MKYDHNYQEMLLLLTFQINSSIGVLKSELTTEINDVSEKLSIDAKDIVERLEKCMKF